MEKEEFKQYQLLQEEIQNQEKIIKNQKTIIYLAIVCIICVVLSCIVNLSGTNLAETKVDFRYFNTANSILQSTKIISGKDKLYLDTYDGMLYERYEDYQNAKIKHPFKENRSFIRKIFKHLSKSS